MNGINKDPSVAVIAIASSFFPYLLCAFVLTVILGNLFALKIITLFSLVTPAGMICFPFTFSICDIINDVYGKEAANKAIITGVISLIIYFIFLKIVTIMEPAHFWKNQKEWELIFDNGVRIFLGTLIAFYVGEKINSFILSILKYLNISRKLTHRYLSSTLIGVTFDTVIFSFIAFLFILPINEIIHLMCTQLLLKYGFEFFGSILAAKISLVIKKKEKIDTIDAYPWLDFLKIKPNLNASLK